MSDGSRKCLQKCTKSALPFDGITMSFLETNDKEGDYLIDGIVTDNETWVRYVNCEANNQFMDLSHTCLAKKSRICLHTFVVLYAENICCTV